MHFDHTSDLHPLLTALIENEVSLPDATLIKPDKGQLAELIFIEFESESYQLQLGIDLQFDFTDMLIEILLEIKLVSFFGVGQIVDDRVERRLDSFVFIGGT